MGKHFDDTVELVRKHLGEDDMTLGRPYTPHANTRAYLAHVLEQAALFEFPLKSNGISAALGKEGKSYWRYIDDFLDLSVQHRQTLLMPYPITAIEDPESVVIMDPAADGSFRMVTGESDGVSTYLSCTRIKYLDARGECVAMEVEPLYDRALNNKGVIQPFFYGKIGGVPARHAYARDAAVSFIEELTYIMDPDNFIIKREGPQARRPPQPGRRHKNGRPDIRKTSIRPHYLIADAARAKDIMAHGCEDGESTRIAHFVRGHTRRLLSEKWTNKRGQIVFVRQHCRGLGVTEHDGHRYEVIVKTGPDSLVPFSRLEASCSTGPR